MRLNRGYMICKSGHRRTIFPPAPPQSTFRRGVYRGRLFALYLKDPADYHWSRVFYLRLSRSIRG